MARAYGEWFRENGIRATDAIIATVYVVDRGVITLMEGGYVDLARELQGTPIHVNIEVIDSTRRGDRYHMLVDTDKTIGSLVRALRSQRKPFVYAFPTPTKRFSPKPLDEVLNQSVRRIWPRLWQHPRDRFPRGHQAGMTRIPLLGRAP